MRLVLGLLDSDSHFVVDNLLGAVFLADGDRVHRSDLHSDSLSKSLINGLVESYDSTELAVEVDVLGNIGSLEGSIVSEKVLLTGLSGLSGNLFFNSMAI